MAELYDWFEGVVMWGAVVFAVGLVFYLAYLQYRKVKCRRFRRRRHARRAMRRAEWASAQRQAGQDQPARSTSP